jgi:hypothetical protein
MASRTDRDVLDETLQRLIRTETRLMTLGSKMGFELKEDEDITVNTVDKTVVLQTLDVPFTSVIKMCRRVGLHGKKITVFYDGERVAEMPV